jgi:hypothetical protein
MGLPKLVLVILALAVLWPLVRWLSRLGDRLPPGRAAAPGRRIEAEDLSACRVCGAYAAAGAAGCGRPDCPQAR